MSKKILFVIENLGDGGAERVMSVLANELIKYGYSVDIAMLEADAKVVYPICDDINLLHIGQKEEPVPERKFVIRLGKKLRCSKLVQYERRRVLEKQIDNSRTFPLRNLLKSGSYDIAISFLVKPNIALIRAAKNLPVKVIISERNYPKRNDYPLALTQLKESAYNGKYDCCVAQTEEILRLLGEKVYNRGTIIENPIKDLPKTNGGERQCVITNYCSFKHQKRLPLLIEAFSKFVLNHSDYKLEIYGDGDRTKLDNLIDSLGLSGCISINPFAKNIHEVIKNYSMFVSTSDFEGISNSMIEAMAVGVPTISTDCDGGGARAVIKDHVNGLLVPKGDCDAIVNAMCEIADNPDLAEKLSANGMKLRDEYSKEKIVKKWISLIEN